MSEWKECQLGDIVDSANTGLDAITRAPIVEKETGLKCLRIQDISQNKPLNQWGNTEVKPEYLQKFQLRKNDIIMARTCSTGICTFINNDINAVFNNGLLRIRANTDLALPVFLYYLFLSRDFIGHIDGISGGTSVQLNMQVGALLSYKFMLPSLPEQRAIAGVLSSIDDKIDLLHRQNKTLEGIAAALWRKTFVEEAEETGEEVSLLELIYLIGGGTPKTDITEYWGGKIPWISAKDITANHRGFIMKTEKSITEKGLDCSSTKLLPKYSTIITARGTVGNYCMLASPMAFSQTNYGVLPKLAECSFYTYLLIVHVVEELKAAAYGSIFDTITTNTFNEQKVNLPLVDDVRKFENNIKPYFEKILSNSIQIRTLIRQRDVLLPKLMSGEVRAKYER